MRSYNFVTFVYCLVIAGKLVTCSLGPAKTEESEEVAYKKFLNLEAKLKNYLKKGLLEVTKHAFGHENEVLNLNVSDKCLKSIGRLKVALLDMDLWAFEMLDATGLPGGKVLSGTFSSMGGYKQCLNIGDPEESFFGLENSAPTKGQYCVVNARGPMPPRPKFIWVDQKLFEQANFTFNSSLMKKAERLFMRLYDNAYTFGICIPSQCSIDDLSTAFDYITGTSGLKLSIESCEIKEPLALKKIQVFVIVAASLITGVCVILSVVDEVQRYSDSTESELKKPESGYGIEIARAFSIRRNFEQFMTTKKMDNITFECLNGIRCMAMFWVILGHSYNLHGRTVLGNTVNVRHMIADFFFQVIANGFLAVVTFLFIGSTLISYGVVKTYDSRRTFNPLIIALRRVLRLLPSMFLALGAVFIFPLVGSGPTFKTMTSMYYDKCYKYWWMTTLFVANLIDYKKMCMTHAWYLCVDMQLFTIGLLYFFILFKSKVFAKAFLSICLLACFISCGLVIYLEGYPPTIIFTLSDKRFGVDYMQKFFTMPFVYLGPYAIGLFLGTYMARVKTPPKIPMKVALIGWIAAISLGITSVYAVYPWNNGLPYSTWEAVSYGSLHRTTWTICVAWVVVACYSGKGGVVKSILCWKGYQPLVRLSYLVYLVHPYVAFHYDLAREEAIETENATAIYYFCGMTVITHVICVPLRILYEAPISHLERIFFKWLHSRGKKEQSISINTNGNVIKTIEEYNISNEKTFMAKSLKTDDRI